MNKVSEIYDNEVVKARELSRMDSENRERKIKSEHDKGKRHEQDKALLKTFEFKKVDVSELMTQTARDDQAFEKRLPFVNEELSQSIPLIPGHFYIVGAISGTGKTTTCAAMVHAILKVEAAKPVLVLSNEEKCVDFFGRLACLDLGFLYSDYHYRKMGTDEMNMVRSRFAQLSERVFFVNSALTRSVDGLKTILSKTGIDGFSAVFLDYIQGVKSIELGTAMEPTEALYGLKHFITEYTATAPVPFVAFSQLKPMSAGEVERNVELRLKWCTGMYEAAHFVVEAINVPRMMSTLFWTDKVRFGTKHQLFPCKFNKGKYEFLNPEEFEAHKVDLIARQVENVSSFDRQLTDEDRGTASE